MSIDDLTGKIETRLMQLGADIVGFGDLTELKNDIRENLPIGISIAVAYPGEVIKGITEFPTKDYYKWYNKLNEQLDAIVTQGATLLRESGYAAVARTRDYVTDKDDNKFENETSLPQKTIATRAGIGWIGKCALLVTEKYGSAVRISSILTNAPLETASPINKSLCGECFICTNACPAKAATGCLWEVGIHRDEFFDVTKCRKIAKERAKQGIGEEITLCGKCIEVCPYTQQYITRGRETPEVKFYEINEIDDSLLTFAVIVSRYMNKWVWCKNKIRNGWEVPGGRREKDETIFETAKRELFEETGAIIFNITPVCAYSVIKETETFGMLFFADISEFGDLPENEIEKISFFHENPNELSFPHIQPKLMSRVKDSIFIN